MATTVTLTDVETGEQYRFAVKYRPDARKYSVRSLDEGWHCDVDPLDVPGVLSARNIAISAATRFDDSCAPFSAV